MNRWSAPNRREFLKFLAASPLLGAAGQVQQGGDIIASAQDALNVFDFETVARQKLPPAHFGYLATGVDDDATVRANREGFSRYQMRSRRLIDVSRIDTSIRLMGVTWKTPIVLAPVSSQRAFHPEGELAVARAARSKGHLLMLSTLTTDADRGRERGARRTRLVPALRHHRLERDALDGQAGRGGRLSGAGLHCRSDQRHESRDPAAVRTPGHARLPRLPRSHQPADQERAQTDVQRTRPCGSRLAAARDLGLCQAPQGYDLDAPRDQGHRHARGRGRSPSPTAPTRSSVRITAGAPRRRDDRRSRASRKCWKAPRAAFPSSSTAASGVARTSSRPSPLAPPPSAWGDRMCGAWRRLARKASKPSSTSSRGNSSWPCATREQPRFRTSRGRTSSSGGEERRRLGGTARTRRRQLPPIFGCRSNQRQCRVEHDGNDTPSNDIERQRFHEPHRDQHPRNAADGQPDRAERRSTRSL